MRYIVVLLFVLLGCSRSMPGTPIEGASVRTAESGGLESGIGIAAGPRLVAVLQAGCALPCTASQVIQPASGAQRFIRFQLYQGRDPDISSARALGTYEVSWGADDEVPEAIEVVFSADDRGAYLESRNTETGARLEVSRVAP